MRSVSRPVLLALSLIACQNQSSPPPPPAPAAPAPTPAPPAKPEVVVPSPNAPKRLSFEIVKVYPDQSNQPTSPWHTKGGDWTYFDAKTSSGTNFIIGLPPRLPHSPKSLAYDQVLLATPDRVEGAKLVDELSHALGVPPPAKGPEKAVHPLEVMTSTLVDNAMRNANGDFGGVGGGWASTKWTIGSEDGADLYFNYNLGAKQGEWAEKDPDSDAPFVAALARAVRDGSDEPPK